MIGRKGKTSISPSKNITDWKHIQDVLKAWPRCNDIFRLKAWFWDRAPLRFELSINVVMVHNYNGISLREQLYRESLKEGPVQHTIKIIIADREGRTYVRRAELLTCWYLPYTIWYSTLKKLRYIIVKYKEKEWSQGRHPDLKHLLLIGHSYITGTAITIAIWEWKRFFRSSNRGTGGMKWQVLPKFSETCTVLYYYIRWWKLYKGVQLLILIEQ